MGSNLSFSASCADTYNIGLTAISLRLRQWPLSIDADAAKNDMDGFPTFSAHLKSQTKLWKS
jgi:hypothetical protein